VHWSAFFASADCSEILGCFWNLLGKNFENDAALLFFVISVSDLDVKECLNIFSVEGWQLVEIFGWLWSFFLLVNTFSEKLFHSVSLASIVLFLLSFKQLELGPQLFIARIEGDSLLHVCRSFVEILELHVGDTTEVPCLDSFWVDFDC